MGGSLAFSPARYQERCWVKFGGALGETVKLFGGWKFRAKIGRQKWVIARSNEPSRKSQAEEDHD